MDVFLEACALALAAVILIPVVKQSRELGTLLSLGVCAMICISAGMLMEPVIGFLEELRQAGDLDGGFLAVLLKACGIGLLSQLAVMICTDAGENAMGRAVGILANAAVLLLSLPMLRQLLELLEEVLGRI